jgi:hypothetical protein
MLKKLSAVIVVLASSSCSVAVEYGVVADITAETMTIKNDKGLVKYPIGFELLTNTRPQSGVRASSDKFINVKKGDKVEFEYEKSGMDITCVCIHLDKPDGAGTVTEVGQDRVTVRNDRGETCTYKVTEELAKNTWPDVVYTYIYPSRFAEVKKGCRIEFRYYKKDGEFLISQIDVRKENEKDK